MLQDVVKIMRDCGAFYLATCDGDQARVRPFGSVMAYEDKIWFCTGNNKPVYDQLVAYPKVEICALQENGDWLRLCGKAVFSDDMGAKKAMFEADESLPEIYGSPEGKEFVVFYLDCLTAKLYHEEDAPKDML